MKLLAALLLVLAAFTFIPAASAHQCGTAARTSDCYCPVPDDGQYHQHAYGGQACQGGPMGQQNAGSGGASQSIPGPGVLVAISALALVALSRR